MLNQLIKLLFRNSVKRSLNQASLKWIFRDFFGRYRLNVSCGLGLLLFDSSHLEVFYRMDLKRVSEVLLTIEST